ncbi:YqgQ family protein [Tepidibacillus marianensis]|uniref:YqgQ family protein n=1 Tax=Tepidibacillus marianensis TaxID=3131995 RepID=UPI0030CF4C0F
MSGADLIFVRELLKQFGTFIYTGERLDDLVLMELELQDLFEYKMISDEDYMKAKLILSKTKRELEE